MAKRKTSKPDTSFDFGFNVLPKSMRPKRGRRRKGGTKARPQSFGSIRG